MHIRGVGLLSTLLLAGAAAAAEQPPPNSVHPEHPNRLSLRPNLPIEAFSPSRPPPPSSNDGFIRAAAADYQDPFEVHMPIKPPSPASGNPADIFACPVTLMPLTSFAWSYGKPYIGSYTPPRDCVARGLGVPAIKAGSPLPNPHKIVLDMNTAGRGRQFDRIGAVWLGGVELLRTCTAEPSQEGIVWTVDKDVSRYASVFAKEQNVVVQIDNIVDSTYVGIFNTTLTATLYYDKSSPATVPGTSKFAANLAQQSSVSVSDTNQVNADAAKRGRTKSGPRAPADLIIPISASNNGSGYFSISSSTESKGVNITLPRNIARAEIEVYASQHGCDEFWYTNPPTSYASKYPGMCGNGVYRRVSARLDGKHTLISTPVFPTIFSGGINPLLWRPISATHAFDLRSYIADITPLVGLLVDGKPHSFTLDVTNAQSYWYLTASLHLWLDAGTDQTAGGVFDERENAPAENTVSAPLNNGLNGTIWNTTATYSLRRSGWVRTSAGLLTVRTSSSVNLKHSLAYVDPEGNTAWYDGETSTKSDSLSTLIGSGNIGSGGGGLHFGAQYSESNSWPNYGSIVANVINDNNYTINSTVAVGEHMVATRREFDLFPSTPVQVYKVDSVLKGNGYVKSGAGGLASTSVSYKGRDDARGICYSRDVAASAGYVTSDNTGNSC
ncbi:hypothetical protein GQ42DRAFT_160672 [Ramicandelaber brevisporus]|nr:hypothetical protein GQ42DRAFT_160672 [Ramicandelaber brevisporus]